MGNGWEDLSRHPSLILEQGHAYEILEFSAIDSNAVFKSLTLLIDNKFVNPFYPLVVPTD